MFAVRNLHRSVFLLREYSGKVISSNLIQPSKPREDGLFPSTMQFNPGNVWYRAMSTSKGRSMRSKVEKRMKKESGKTLREIRRAKKIQKKLMTDNERLVYNLKRAKKKVALLLQKLKKYELPELPSPRHDPELLTPEQLQAYKKIGFRNKNYVPVGVRGVFGGVVQNMHLHWKFHETVQVCCDNFPKEKIKEMASMLARLSGGIVINVHNVKTIIMFRGRNYRQPKNLIPLNTLTKRKALFKARFEQALESQKLNIKKIEQQLRRSGINPEDPVATASIQRVAASFFNAIDKKEGTPYVFHGDKLSLKEPDDNLQTSEPTDENEQKELDKFIAEIEDAAEREWAAEEAAEKEEFGRIRYWNREEFGGKFGRSETLRDDGSEDDIRGDRRWRNTRGKHNTYNSDDEHDDDDDDDDDEGDDDEGDDDDYSDDD
ncbi:CRM-domain containing factor CFM9, mitochondrial isoform X2 [Ziziphus jujuba]|uniref:CRM-domain containing factor CFM9, mitochondrial isoform X2 n=1 Tax=Ziziphus jujuba TaxID=326968 RepID=A0A6P6G1Q2_ZIZJJ|nr:CRM-domain containing factor CFM9, mitochondrial isoform X2 [Ziziphus jujuba]